MEKHVSWSDLVDRQQGIHNLSDKHLEAIRDTRVAVIGTGGNGAVLDVLVRTGYEKFVILDFDDMEASNLNRLPLPPSGIGHPKVEIWEEYLTSVNKACEIRAHQKRLSFDNLDWLVRELGDCDVVANCISTADADGVLTLSRACRLLKKPMVAGPGTANCWVVTTIVHDDDVSLESVVGLDPSEPWPPEPERLRELFAAFQKIVAFPGRTERLLPGVTELVRSGEQSPRSCKIFVMMVNAALAWEITKNVACLNNIPLELTDIVRFPFLQIFDPFRGASYYYNVCNGYIGTPHWQTGEIDWQQFTG